VKSGKLQLRIASNHPVGAGHFPGNPIIPGALLLAEVARLIETELATRFVSFNIKSAKFFHPARPGDAAEVEFSVSAQGDISFNCSVNGVKVLAGTMDAKPNG
jgi:3-hydroxyacyl-[acyl-carrier-protein] dehydratase